MFLSIGSADVHFMNKGTELQQPHNSLCQTLLHRVFCLFVLLSFGSCSKLHHSLRHPNRLQVSAQPASNFWGKFWELFLYIYTENESVRNFMPFTKKLFTYNVHEDFRLFRTGFSESCGLLETFSRNLEEAGVCCWVFCCGLLPHWTYQLGLVGIFSRQTQHKKALKSRVRGTATIESCSVFSLFLSVC